MILPKFYVDDIIKNAIKEDINYLDISSAYVLDENERVNAYFVSKADSMSQ